MLTQVQDNCIIMKFVLEIKNSYVTAALAEITLDDSLELSMLVLIDSQTIREYT